jgi:asparagine synthase (glutamine-hydrolysing)
MPSEFDESRYIEATVAQARARVHRVSIDGRQVWDAIPRVLWHHDEPMHSATAIIGYEIYRRAAAAGVKVMLCGQGADETIGGYHSYFPDMWSSLLRRGRVAETWGNVREYASLNGGEPGALFRGALKRQVKLQLRRASAYRALAAARRRRRERLAAGWFAPEIVQSLPEQIGPIGRGTLDDALRYAVKTAPLPLYLRIEDRNSMAHSVEARLPFLDYRLVSLDFQLPVEWRLRGGLNKFVLREAMRGRIPEVVRARVDKMGFPTPDSAWFRRELYEPMQDLLASRATAQRGLYRTDIIRADLERHRRGELNVGASLFNVAQMEIWLQADLPATTGDTPRGVQRAAVSGTR